jgi:hypothetical protein
MSEDPVSIQFTYTPADYVEGSRAAGLCFRPSRLRFSWVAHYVFTAVGIIGGPWVMLSNPGDHSAMLIGSAVFGLGLWYLYGLGIYVWREHFGLRRDFARMEVLQGIREMQFDETTHRTRRLRRLLGVLQGLC